MIEIIKYTMLRYHGLPMVFLGLLPAILMDLLLFQELSVSLTVPAVVLMIPYFELTSRYFVNIGLRPVNHSLPMSFNKIWLAKLISFFTLYCLCWLLFLPLIIYFTDSFQEILDKIFFNWLLGYSILFMMGKWILFKLKSFTLILLSLVSLFGIAIFIFNKSEIFEMLQNAIGIEQDNPLMVLVYIILMVFLIAEDYLISYLSRNKIVGLS